MRRVCPIVLSLLAGTVAAANQAAAAPPPSPAQSGSGGPVVQAGPGAETYRSHCASCHGADGKGDGPRAANLGFHPADLTLITSRHGGSYPSEEIYRIVEGRRPLRGHGAPDMPIWGDAFRKPETGYDEAAVKEKIRSVVDYIRTLQVPAKK